MITTIAAQQSLLLRRQRVALVGLATMLAVTAMAGILGWSSHHTIVRVFDQAVRLHAAAGQPAPPNPFSLKPNLSLLSNMVVYIPLIGALLALVLGHLILVEDQGKRWVGSCSPGRSPAPSTSWARSWPPPGSWP